MIFSQESKETVINRIIKMSSNFSEFGLSEATIDEDNQISSIVWKRRIIGLEVEIDWREIDLYVLLVKLEDGDLPNGYYVSNGHPCRYHLQKIIKEKQWDVDPLLFSKISKPLDISNRAENELGDVILERYSEYKLVIDSLMERIIFDEGRIFDS